MGAAEAAPPPPSRVYARPWAPPTPAEVAGFGPGMQLPGKTPKLTAPWSASYWRPAECKDSRPVTPQSDLMYFVPYSLRKKYKRPSGWYGNTEAKAEAIIAQTVERLASGEGRCTVLLAGEDTATPDLKPGAWGSCAFVAQGDVLLRRYSQAHIDSYDTVVRLGHMKLKGFERFTGERCDVLFRHDVRANEDDGSYTTLKYIINGVHTRSRTTTPTAYPTAKILDMKCSSGTVADELYPFMTGTIPGRLKHRKSSSGAGAALKLYESRLCTSIHLYGLSVNCGGRYSSGGKEVMKVVHSCELESWIFHHLMRTSKHPNQLCVYI